MQSRYLLRTGALAGIALLAGRAFAQSAATGDEVIPCPTDYRSSALISVASNGSAPLPAEKSNKA